MGKKRPKKSPKKQSRQKRASNTTQQSAGTAADESWRVVEIIGDLILGLTSAVLFGMGLPKWGILFGYASLCCALLLLAHFLTHRFGARKLVWSICCLLIIGLLPVVVACFKIILRMEEQQRLSLLSDLLIPADQPVSAFFGHEPPQPGFVLMGLGNRGDPRIEQSTNVIKLYAGEDSQISVTSLGPIPLVEYKGEVLLSLGRNEAGAWLSGTFKSRTGDIVAEIKTNRFLINERNYLEKDRPDRHTLSVRDQEGNEVVFLRYQNQSNFIFMGNILLPNGGRIIINRTNVSFPGEISATGMGYSSHDGPIFGTARNSLFHLLTPEELQHQP